MRDPNLPPPTDAVGRFAVEIAQLKGSARASSVKPARTSRFRSPPIGDGTTTVFEISHNRGVREVDVFALSNDDQQTRLALVSDSRPAEDLVVVEFAEAPPADGAIVIIL